MKKSLAFKMKLHEGMKEEYEKRHNEIWPELRNLLQANGVEEYHIFLDEETNILFAFQTISGENNSQDLGNTEIVKKWWAFMKDIMETNPDDSPVSLELEKVFSL
ncbi:MAG: L-rhamnose mutarotase [Flammeovirgaceae bacterium]|nr:L-rhamnose mutarotase [Flammeovirgaceae bacterium]